MVMEPRQRSNQEAMSQSRKRPVWPPAPKRFLGCASRAPFSLYLHHPNLTLWQSPEDAGRIFLQAEIST